MIRYIASNPDKNAEGILRSYFWELEIIPAYERGTSWIQDVLPAYYEDMMRLVESERLHSIKQVVEA
jgi:hypothetical protein